MGDHSDGVNKMVDRASQCETHHHACDCREAHFAQRESYIMQLELAVELMQKQIAKCNANCTGITKECLRNTSQVPDKKRV